MTDVIMFGADWCGPCGQQKEIMDEFEERNPSIDVERVDIDEDMDRANEYSVRSVPTVTVEDNGDVVEQFIGLTQLEDLEAVV